MPCPVEVGMAKEPYVDHHGDSSREIIVTALCSRLLFETLGESDAMTDCALETTRGVSYARFVR
jgi:hypothetical protein